MFGSRRKNAGTPAVVSGTAHASIDLDTVRETLVYLHDDMKSAPSLAKIRDALAVAMAEIAAHEADLAQQGSAKTSLDRQHVHSAEIVAFASVRPRFVAWSPNA